MIKFEITIKSLLCLLIFLISIKCSKKDIDDNEINIVSDVDSESSDSQQEITLSTEINDFIWKGLNQYYYWQESVVNLSDSKKENESDYYYIKNPKKSLSSLAENNVKDQTEVETANDILKKSRKHILTGMDGGLGPL